MGALTITINHPSDFDFKDFMNFCKKLPVKPYSFLLCDTTVTSDNPLRFILLERILKVSMTIDDKIRDEKLQCDINRKAAQVSPLFR